MRELAADKFPPLQTITAPLPKTMGRDGSAPVGTLAFQWYCWLGWSDFERKSFIDTFRVVPNCFDCYPKIRKTFFDVLNLRQGEMYFLFFLT